MESNHSIKIRTGKVWLDEESGIVRVAHEPGSIVALDDAKEQIAAVAKVAQGKRLPFLIDMRSLRFTEQDARDYFGSAESIAAWCAAALLVGSAPSTAVGTMWVAVHGTLEAPSKVFSSEAEAITWLRGFVP